MNIYAQTAGGAYRRHYTTVSKQVGAFRVHSSFNCNVCLLVMLRLSSLRHEIFFVVYHFHF